MECKVCFESYNDTTHKPMIIVSCGHTFCRNCLASLKQRICPGCRGEIRGFPGLQINYVILSLLLNKSEDKSSLFKDSLYNYLIKDIEEDSNRLKLTHSQKLNECIDKFNLIRIKIQQETEKRIEKFLKQNEILFEELDSLKTKIISDINQIIDTDQDDIKCETKIIQTCLNSNELDLNQVNKLKEKTIDIQEKLNLKIESLENVDLNYDFKSDSTDLIGQIVLQNDSNKIISKHSLSTCSYSEIDKTKMNSTIFSASGDNTIKVWNANNGELIRTMNGHSNLVRCLALLPDSTLASGSSDKTVKIWNTINGELINTLQGHTDSILCVILLKDEITNEPIIVSSSADRQIIIWNTKKPQLIKNWKSNHLAEVYSLCSLENGNKLATGSYKEIKIWNLNDYQLIRTLNGYFLHVYSLNLLDEGQLVSSGEQTINIWNAKNEKIIKTLEGQTNTILSVAILPNDRIASGSADSIIRIWNINNCSLIRVLKGHTNGIWSLALVDDNKLASGSLDKMIIIWDLNSGQLLNTLKGHDYGVWSIVVKNSIRI